MKSTHRNFLVAGPLAEVKGLEQAIVAGQHPLNYVRHELIYASMYLMTLARQCTAPAETKNDHSGSINVARPMIDNIRHKLL